MKKGKTSKRSECFRLFDEGKDKKSPEVKQLGIKASTLDTYHLSWRKSQEEPISQASSDSRGKNKVINENELLVVPSEEDEGTDPDNEEIDANGKNVESKLNIPTKDSQDGKKPTLPTMVAGQGLTFAITISTKTLALYQYAASLNESELTIGDFIDTCVEDYYKGRGLDLGLVKIGGDGHG